MLDFYIDGDACPVKDEAIRVAERHGLQVYLVSNAWLNRRRHSQVQLITVEAGADAADDWIVERIGESDIAVTADILLADRCLKKHAVAISPSGKLFTNDNIGAAVAKRSLSSHLRELGEVGHNPSFTPQDRSRFLQALENAVQAIKRRMV